MRMIWIFLWLAPFTLAGQYKFSSYTAQEGLGSNGVYELCYDRNGYLWINNVSSLSRFDGVKFDHFPAPEGHTYSALALDALGRLWAGGSMGLLTFDEANETFRQPTLSGAILPGTVESLLATPSGPMWILDEAGLKKLDIQTLVCHATPLPAEGLSALTIDSQGILWLGSFGKNLYRWDPESTRYQIWPLPGETAAIAASSSGEIWIGSNQALLKFDPATGQTRTFAPAGGIRQTRRPFSITGLAFCPEWKGDSILFISTFNDGLVEFNTISEIFIPPFNSFPARTANQILWDPKGLLWVGTLGQGLVKFDLQDQEFQQFRFSFADDLQDAEITRVVADGATWWMSTAGKGVIRYDPQKNKVTQWFKKPAPLEDFPESSFFSDLCLDATGQVWAGGLLGLFTFPDQKQVLAGRNILKIQLSNQTGRLWLLSSKGPGLFFPGTGKVRWFDVPLKKGGGLITTPYREMWEAADGVLWMATTQGLFSIDPASQVVSSYLQEGDSHMNNWINRLAPDGTGGLYLATIEGVFRFDLKEKKFNRVELPPLQAENLCVDLHVDSQNRLWLFSLNGIYRKNLETGELLRIISPAGFISSSFLGEQPFLHEVGNRLVLVKDGRALSFDPLLADENRFPARPLIHSIRVQNEIQPFNPNKDNRFAHNRNFFTFHFTATNFTLPERTRFRYILEGFDADWTETDQIRLANYTNLPPGQYKFRLYASNSAGQWSQEEANYAFHIIPPIWGRTWFQVLVAGLLVLLVILLFRSRIKKLRKELEATEREAGYRQREAELQKEVAEFSKQVAEVELAALRAQMNPHFVFNCLNSINTFILLNDPDNASNYLNKFSKLIRRVLDASRSDHISLQDELDTLRYYIELEQMRYGGKFNFRITVAETLDTGAVEIPPMLVQPYVENAIWHGLMHLVSPGGLLQIDVSHTPNALQIQVEDNGVGRAKARELKSRSALTHKSHGIQLTGERIQIIKDLYGIQANVNIQDLFDQSGAPRGTRVILTLPFQQDFHVAHHSH